MLADTEILYYFFSMRNTAISRFFSELKEREWTQKRIALECSVTGAAVNNWQRCTRIPAHHIFKFEQICADAGIDLPRHLFERGCDAYPNG